MTLKKSLFMLYNVALQDDLVSDLLKQIPFLQLREVVFMYNFGKILMNYFFLIPYSQSDWNGDVTSILSVSQ